MSKDGEGNWKQKAIIALAVVVLSPFAAKLGNGAMGLFSTPAELKATNERITRDSIENEKRLRDSISVYRQAFSNMRNRLAQVENDNQKIKTKLKIR